jgi:tetratricopeptide (TPR) repeat protein
MRQRLIKDPDDFNANYNLGDALLNKGDAAGAIPYFQAAYRANPTSIVAATELGTALFAAGKLAEAQEQFRSALALDRGYTDARFALASVEAASGQFDASTEDFRQVLRERPDDTKIRQHLGDALYLWGDELAKSGKTADALARYRDASAFRAPTAELHTKMALMLARGGQFQEAQSELETALRIDPNFSPARQMLKDVQTKLAQ